MVDLNLQIALHGENDVYRPADVLRGTVTITSPGGQEDVKEAELLVFWRTSGIGTSDDAVVHRENLVAEKTTLPTYFTREFIVTLPQQPWTYAGKLIKIDWYVGVYVKTGWKGRQETEVGFQLRPEGMAPVEDFPDRGGDTMHSDSVDEIYYDDRGRPMPPPRGS